MFRRVAATIAAADLKYGKSQSDVEALEGEFFEIMTGLEFLPNSPTLMNAGRRLGQLSACFVLPVGDSMESIFDGVKNAALIHKSGGGTGFSFSRLRPGGDMVGSTKGVSSGPLSFMTVFDTATEAVKQGGTRRGANMAMLRADHPDILDFIACKENSDKLNNFNISVALTEKFMDALERGEEYDLINPRSGASVKRLDAGYVFDLIVKHAWENGEPGIVFIDRINESNPTPHIGEIEATNPCGEQPLLPYESCNLGSINLSTMVGRCAEDGAQVVGATHGVSVGATHGGNGGATHGGNGGAPHGVGVDWDKLRRVTALAVHFLDNVIDLNNYPLKKIEEITRSNRKIGLGVMGWADMLIHLGIPYNSDDALVLADKVMGFIRTEGRAASEELASERGVFPNYAGSVYDGNIRLRNATITTIAPTGTLSIIAGSSSGIEPLFAVSYVRNVMDGTKLIEVNPCFEKVAHERGFYSKRLMELIAESASLKDFQEIPEDVRNTFVTAHDISPEVHIKMQAAFQRHVDNAVSKTVNFPNSATAEDVKHVYLMAYKQGCKGVTVYRDGSRDEQVLSVGGGATPGVHGATTHGVIGVTTPGVKDASPHFTQGAPPRASNGLQISADGKIIPRKRPKVVTGTTQAMTTGCGHLYVTVNEDEQGLPFEVFNHIGKGGGCAGSQSEAIGRLVSLALRCNIAPEQIAKQLKGISCHQPIWADGGKISSCADAIAKAIENYVRQKPDGGILKSSDHAMFIGACPECGGAVEHESGCAVCHDCGFTRCG
jgi:ribonucleoside-diphosphate reductase alpha chain